MKLSRYVRKTPKPLTFFLKKRVAYSIFPYIFLPEQIYNNLLSENPKATFQALLIHEEEHRRRQRENPIKFALQYVFSTFFRRSEELRTVKIAVQYLKGRAISIDLTKMQNLYDPDFLFLYPASEFLSTEQPRELVNY